MQLFDWFLFTVKLALLQQCLLGRGLQTIYKKVEAGTTVVGPQVNIHIATVVGSG
jgi:hypothetical protein